MKLSNTTDFDPKFLRRMTVWCCKQIELPSKAVRLVHFGKRSRGAYRGTAWSSGRIRVMIGPAKAFPVEPHLYPGRKHKRYLSPRIADQMEALVAVTTHELTHLRDYAMRRRNGWRGRGPGESNTRAEERRVHALFVANRDQLVAQWAGLTNEKSSKKAKTGLDGRRTIYIIKGTGQAISKPSQSQKGTQAMTIHITAKPISTERFSWDRTEACLSIEASDATKELSGAHEVCRDARNGRLFDTLWIVSAKTGRVEGFYRSHTERQDGDLLWHDYKPLNSACAVKLVRIYND